MKPKKPEHASSEIKLNGQWYARCICGWRGDTHKTWETSLTQWAQHSTQVELEQKVELERLKRHVEYVDRQEVADRAAKIRDRFRKKH